MWTMIEGFKQLSGEEIDALIQAPVLITILIGTADGELDRDERMWSERLMHARTYSKNHLTTDYYRVVDEHFLEKIDQALSQLPTETEARCIQIAEQLGAINPILAKLDTDLAAALYNSFVGLANETAKASGGFLRMGSISAAEYKWLKLPMLLPIEAETAESEEESE